MTASPPITSRAAWGANPLTTPASSIATPSRDLWLHHTGSTGLHGASGMRSLQAGALSGGYVDVEYSYVVDNPSGQIFEARGPGRNSAATANNNETSHAICGMGYFHPPHNDVPSDAFLNAVAQLVAWGHERGYWPAAITGPHRDAPGNSTACCGDGLIAKIGEINKRAASGATAPAKPPPSVGGAVQIVATSSGKGYWICAEDGGVFSFGDAPYHGSMGGKKLNAPVVGMAATAGDKGYALVASDGGVFTFGNVTYHGGMGGEKLVAPVVAIALDPDGKGYWLLGADGGVFAFAAPYKGNAVEFVK